MAVMARFCATVIVLTEVLTSKSISISIMRQSISNFLGLANTKEKEVKCTSYFGLKL